MIEVMQAVNISDIFNVHTELINSPVTQLIYTCNLELIPQEIGEIIISAVGDDPVGLTRTYIREINVISIIFYEYSINIPNSDIATLNTSAQHHYPFVQSADFFYNICVNNARRIIEKAVSNNLANGVNITPFTPSYIHNFLFNLNTNLNYYEQNYLENTALYTFIFLKKHLALFIAPIYIMVRNLSSNKFSLYLLLLIIQAKPVKAANNILANKLISGIVWFAYINIMAMYDVLYKNIQNKQVYQTLIKDGRVNFRFLNKRLILGISWVFVINAGVLFTTCMSILIVPSLSVKLKVTAGIVSIIISTLSSVIWIKLADRTLLGYGTKVLINSYLRAIAESFAFSSLSFANFIIWSFIGKKTISYVIAFLVGLVCYFGFSIIQVMLEMNLEHTVLYGFIYNFVFSSLSVSSSGLYSLINSYALTSAAGSVVKPVVIAICYNIMILLPLEVYRFKQPNITLGENNNNSTLLGYLIGKNRSQTVKWRILQGVLYQLIVFFAFAIGTFIIFDYTGLGTNIV